MLSQSGYRESLRDEDIRFVDLNRDELVRTQLCASFMGMKSLWLPRTVLEADFLVSMPKIKAHHWAGVTLSMKNMLGVVPGSRYGWPKNILHWKGIQESILDVCATIPVHFVIADGIMAMEGNGPLNGTARPLGKIVLADDPVAADATCARLMGFEPDRVVHIREGAKFLGTLPPHLSIRREKFSNLPRIRSKSFRSSGIFMCFDRRAFVFMSMKSGLGDEKPYWSYEDIGVFSLVLAVLAPILHLFARLHLLHDPNLRIWSRPAGRSDRVFDAIVVLDTQTTASATGVPTIRLGLAGTAYVILAPLLGVSLAAGVRVYLHLHGHSTPHQAAI